jgi:hypothetical protein
MPHASNIVHCAGPEAPHAFDTIPLQPRNGALDALCPVCKGHGQWNAEIDLVSFRARRINCDRCHGEGWVETGADPVCIDDIEMSPDGHPHWVTRHLADDDPANPGPSDDGPDLPMI